MNSEEFVSEDNGCACCRTSLKAELLERADMLSVEVSVLSLREGRSLTIRAVRTFKKPCVIELNKVILFFKLFLKDIVL